MANLTKTKTLFGITSPRTLQKVIPEIDLLIKNYSGKKWSGNSSLQTNFFRSLFDSNFYEGDSYPDDPALAARDRITRAPKALGFVDLAPTIQLTEIGQVLLSGIRNDETFTRQLLKFQLPSPYHKQSTKIDFKIRPYLELIRLINDLGSISKTEIALFFLQLTSIDDYQYIVEKIKSFRANAAGYSGSRKMYVSQCFSNEIKEIYKEEIESDKIKTRENENRTLSYFISTKAANMRDYADAFSRYIRATELVTFEKKTFRLIISPQKQSDVDFILENTPREPIIFSSESDFKTYLFSPNSLQLYSDNKELLMQKINELGLSDIDPNIELEELKEILHELQNKIRLSNLDEQVKELKNYKELPEINNVFKKIINKEIPDPPLFLEWNVWRSFVMLNYANRIEGNFVVDIDGMPLNTAPGNKADLEIEFGDFAIIGEVTMSSGATQFKMEGDSVPRHFGDFKKRIGKETYCVFIAPVINPSTNAFFFNLNKGFTQLYGGATKIIPLSLANFIKLLNIGVSQEFSDPNKLKVWLENRWVVNQSIDDEVAWSEEIENSLSSWAN